VDVAESREEEPAPDLAPIREPLEGNLTRGTYSPAPISYINGVFVWGASEIYRQQFGIGINEWRMLGKLSTFPGSTAADATSDLGMNKSTVSIAMTALLEKGLIVTENEGRTRRMYLTERGAELYQRIRPIAEERERIMLAALDDEEVSAFRGYLERIATRGPALRSFDMELLGASATEEDAAQDSVSEQSR
jgi:DNA-binding MarR family transcriptional regulator